MSKAHPIHPALARLPRPAGRAPRVEPRHRARGLAAPLRRERRAAHYGHQSRAVVRTIAALLLLAACATQAPLTPTEDLRMREALVRILPTEANLYSLAG